MTRRAHESELLDEPVHDLAELAESLGQVASVNRMFGGTAALLRHLERHVSTRLADPSPEGQSKPVSILDVGTGNGDVAAHIARWSRSRGLHAFVIGVDAHPAVLRVAAERRRERRHDLHLVRGDGLSLPFRAGAFDVSCSTLTLHHFSDDEAVGFVSEMARVARLAVLVNDLERRRLSHWSALLLSRTLWRRNRLTRHDGPVSVLRSFTVPELLDIGRRARLQSPTVRRHFPFRLVLDGKPSNRAGETSRHSAGAGPGGPGSA